MRYLIDTELVCVKCGHIQGLCQCDPPSWMRISDYLWVNEKGVREYLRAKQMNLKEVSHVSSHAASTTE